LGLDAGVASPRSASYFQPFSKKPATKSANIGGSGNYPIGIDV
jgi:hypothetical protein